VLLSRVQGNTDPLRLLLEGAISQVLGRKDRKEEHGLPLGIG
jgi:hypothetical protein